MSEPNTVTPPAQPAPDQEAAPANPTTPSPVSTQRESTPAAPDRPSVGRIRALLGGQTQLTDQLNTANQTITDLTSQLDAANQSIADLTQQLGEYSQLEKDLTAALNTSEQRADTVAAAAAQEVAAIGVEPKDLPSQENPKQSFSERYEAASQAGGSELRLFLEENKQEISQLRSKA